MKLKSDIATIYESRFKEGREEGREQGREEGRLARTLTLARSFKRYGSITR